MNLSVSATIVTLLKTTLEDYKDAFTLIESNKAFWLFLEHLMNYVYIKYH